MSSKQCNKCHVYLNESIYFDKNRSNNQYLKCCRQCLIRQKTRSRVKGRVKKDFDNVSKINSFSEVIQILENDKSELTAFHYEGNVKDIMNHGVNFPITESFIDGSQIEENDDKEINDIKVEIPNKFNDYKWVNIHQDEFLLKQLNQKVEPSKPPILAERVIDGRKCAIKAIFYDDPQQKVQDLLEEDNKFILPKTHSYDIPIGNSKPIDKPPVKDKEKDPSNGTLDDAVFQIAKREIAEQLITKLNTSSGYKFINQSSHFTKETKCVSMRYICCQREKPVVETENPKRLKYDTENMNYKCECSVVISYWLKSNVITIRYNHKNHQRLQEINDSKTEEIKGLIVQKVNSNPTITFDQVINFLEQEMNFKKLQKNSIKRFIRRCQEKFFKKSEDQCISSKNFIEQHSKLDSINFQEDENAVGFLIKQNGDLLKHAEAILIDGTFSVTNNGYQLHCIMLVIDGAGIPLIYFFCKSFSAGVLNKVLVKLKDVAQFLFKGGGFENIRFITDKDMIAYSVSVLSRYLKNPTQKAWKGATRVLRYLKGTADLGLVYQKGENVILSGFSDAAWANGTNRKLSTSGFVTKIGSTVVTWKSSQ